MKVKELIIKLCSAPAVCHIKEAVAVAEQELKTFSSVEVKDTYLRADIGCDNAKTVMLEAHIDQVAMIVTTVYDGGFLSVTPVGAIDGRFLPATPVKIYGKEVIKGVFTSVPPHLKSGSSCPDFDKCLIDTGRTDLKDIVSPGDMVFFDYSVADLKNDRLSSPGLDNRAGCAAVIAAAKKIAEEKLPIHTLVILSMGEELGLRGAKVAAYNAEVSTAIAVDVSFGDSPEVPANKTARLESGTMIGVSPVLNKDIYKNLERLAEKNNIPFTVEVMGGKTGTDADVISITRGGIPTGLLSIPLRNMHTPLEVVSVKDIDATARLIYEFVKEAAEND